MILILCDNITKICKALTLFNVFVINIIIITNGNFRVKKEPSL
jgi:hypothetical protein